MRSKHILSLVDLIEAGVDKLQRQIEEDRHKIRELEAFVNKLDQYDTDTREKFNVLAEHLGVDIRHRFEPQRFEVIELNDNEATEITTNNQ